MDKALKFFQKAADGRHAEAAYAIGVEYSSGDGKSSKVFPSLWSFTSRLTRLYLKLLVTLDREDMERGEMDGDSILRLSPATLVLQ